MKKGVLTCPSTEQLMYSLDHIHTTWIWSLVVTQPIAGGPDAGGFARVSPKPWWCAKGWHSASVLIIVCYRQKPIKVSHRTFILLNIWWFLVNFAVSLPFP
jgi:hypothetical protein